MYRTYSQNVSVYNNRRMDKPEAKRSTMEHGHGSGDLQQANINTSEASDDTSSFGIEYVPKGITVPSKAKRKQKKVSLK